MTIRYRAYFEGVSQVFSLTDAYAEQQGLRGPHPQPLGSVRLQIIGQRIAGQAEPLKWTRPLEMITTRSPSGYYLFYGVIQLPSGEKRHGHLENGTYIIRVESPYYQPSEVDVTLLQRAPEPGASQIQPTNIPLQPGTAYPFSTSRTRPGAAHSKLPPKAGPTLLRGGLYHTDGRGIEGATVEITGLASPARCQADQRGQWVLVVPDEVFPNRAPAGGPLEEMIAIRARWIDPAPPHNPVEVPVGNVIVEWGHERVLAQAALRGWVLSHTGAGLEGAAIQVDGGAGPSTTGKDGSWFYYFLLGQPPVEGDMDVTATLADGRSQTKTVRVRLRATVVVPTFRF